MLDRTFSGVGSGTRRLSIEGRGAGWAALVAGAPTWSDARPLTVMAGARGLPIGVEDLGHVGRAGLLLALEEELQVDGGRPARGLQGVERGQDPDDGGLVVAGRARIESPLARHGRG